VRVGGIEGSFLGVIPAMVDELLAGGGFDFTDRTVERNLMVLSGVVVICGTDIYDDKVQRSVGQRWVGKGQEGSWEFTCCVHMTRTITIIVYAIRPLLRRPICFCLPDLG
jgi:hypothetical protein